MIKKGIVFLTYIISFSSLVVAETNSIGFIGLEGGYNKIEGNTNLIDNYTSSDISYGLRLGAKNDEWRTMFLGTYVDSGAQSIQSGLISFDYYVSKNKEIHPYIGFHIGYSSYESDFIEGNGYLYGGQAGLIFDITKNIDIDINYRYSLAESDQLNYSGTLVFGIDYNFK